MSNIIVNTEGTRSYSLEDIQNKIIHGDAFSVLDKIEPEIFDMVFIDPPYFLQLTKRKLVRWKSKTIVSPINDEWDKFDSFEHYDRFIDALLRKVRRVMKPNGTLWIISTYHSIFRIGKIMQDIGYWILNDVIWFKTNAMPNWFGVRFTNATETLIWAVKSKDSKKYVFNRNHAKEFGFGNTGSNLWMIGTCREKERLKDDTGKKLHNTQKPVELLRRIILTSTNEHALILDPMAGTGTTAYVAQKLNRNFVVVAKEKKYVEVMEKRLYLQQ